MPPGKARSNPPAAFHEAESLPVRQGSDALEERLAAATLGGGLTALPASFGDADGDWTTIRSDDPFEVLYFDYRRADRLTPEMVDRHRTLLQRFWQEKLKSMSQGAGRLAVVKKYGGEHESERLVRSYPDLLERAYHRLSTRGGIEEAYREIATRRQKAVFARIDEKLSDFLVDSALQPQETLVLLEFADREGVARELVAVHVEERLRNAGLVSEEAVSGASLEQRLLSTAWVHPSRKVTPPIPAGPPTGSGLVPLLLFSLVVVLPLVIGAVVYYKKLRPMPIVSSGAPAPTPVHQPMEAVPPKPEPDVTVTPVSEPPLTTPPESRPVPVPPPDPEPPARPAVSEEQRQEVRSELEQIRALGASDPNGVLERVRQLDSRLALQPQDFADERVELANLRGEIQSAMAQTRLAEETARLQREAEEADRQRRAKEWEQRLAQIESLSQQRNFSGAKALADRLLAESDVPEPVAARARKLADEAVEKLQAIFSKTTVKSKTARSADPPQ